MGALLRRYGVAGNVKFVCRDFFTGELLSGLTPFAVNDVQVSTDAGAFSDADNRAAIVEIAAGSGIYQLELSAAELLGELIEVRIEDQSSPQLFASPPPLNIETFGDPDAQYGTDFDDIAVDVRTEMDANSTSLLGIQNQNVVIQNQNVVIQNQNVAIQNTVQTNSTTLSSHTNLLTSIDNGITTLNADHNRVNPVTFVRARGFNSATGIRRA